MQEEPVPSTKAAAMGKSKKIPPKTQVQVPHRISDVHSDLLDLANHRVFGNTSFRHQQRSVIEAILKVILVPELLKIVN